MSTIVLDCPATLLPTPKQLSEMLGQLAAVPGELARQAKLELEGELAEIAGSVQEVVDLIPKVLGNFPMGYIPDGSVKIPEWAFQRLGQSIHNEWKFITQIKIAEIITKVIPLELEIPTPIGISIDVVKLFKDPEYKAELIAEITKMWQDEKDALMAMLPPSLTEVWENMGIGHDEMNIAKLWQWLVNKLSNAMNEIINMALEAAAKLIKLASLGTVDIAALLTLDIEALLTGAIESAKEQAKSLGTDVATMVKDQLLSISIFGFTIEDIMGGAIQEKVKASWKDVEVMMENMRTFAVNWPMYNIELIIEKIMSLLEKVGISLPFIPFTFCDCLKLIGMPLSIPLPAGCPPDLVDGIIENAAKAGGSLDKVVAEKVADGTAQTQSVSTTPPEE